MNYDQNNHFLYEYQSNCTMVNQEFIMGDNEYYFNLNAYFKLNFKFIDFVSCECLRDSLNYYYLLFVVYNKYLKLNKIR